MTTDQYRTDFAAKLKNLTTARDLGLRELAKTAGMSHGLLCDILAARKCAGADIAAKLADAFKLAGADCEAFLLAAAGTRMHDKLMLVSRGVAPEIVNFLPLLLKDAGIDSQNIVECERSGNRLTITCGGGNTVTCTTKIVQAQEGGATTETS